MALLNQTIFYKYFAPYGAFFKLWKSKIFIEKNSKKIKSSGGAIYLAHQEFFNQIKAQQFSSVYVKYEFLMKSALRNILHQSES